MLLLEFLIEGICGVNGAIKTLLCFAFLSIDVRQVSINCMKLTFELLILSWGENGISFLAESSLFQNRRNIIMDLEGTVLCHDSIIWHHQPWVSATISHEDHFFFSTQKDATYKNVRFTYIQRREIEVQEPSYTTRTCIIPNPVQL